MAFQADWRWCNRCQVLFYAGFGNGVCFDEELHDPTGSGPYVVPIDEQPGGTQEGWRWCNRCQGLCFTGHGAGVCHDGEPHDIEGSSTYFVALGEPPAGNQDGWRWCSRCQVLMYAGFGDGLCWDGQRHYPDDSGTYSVEFEVSQRPPPPPPPPPPLPRPPRISVAEDGGQIGVSGDGFAANGRVRLSFVRGADVKKVELTATPGGLFSWFTRSFDQERVGGAVIAVDLASGQFGVGRTQRAFPAFRPIELPPPDLIPGLEERIQMTIEHSYAVASFLFRAVAPDAIGDFPWGRAFLQEVFVDHPDSKRNYWRRASLGLLDLDITILNSAAWIFDDFSQPARKARAAGTGRWRRHASSAPTTTSAWPGTTTWWSSSPDADRLGATGVPPVDVVYEQIDNTLAAMQHEIGHSLGFEHAFGPFIPPPNPYGSVYNDPCCVMGYTGTQSRSAIPPTDAGLAARPKNGAAFWLSERRPSAAALWRHLAEFKLSPQWVSYVEGLGPTTVRIFGRCSVGSQRVTVIAVVPRRGHPNQFLTLEYRPAVGDDAGVAPALVVHSIGINPVGAGHGEVDPPWFEGTIPVAVGASRTLFDYQIRVTAIAAGPPESVEVDIRFVHFPLPA